MSERLSPQREAEIDGRAGELFEYSTSHSPEWDLLAGEDVPVLLAELAAVRAERDELSKRDVTSALAVIAKHGDMSETVRQEIRDLLAEAGATS